VEDRTIAPLRVARLGRKEIPIVLMSAGPRETIDARAATEHLAHVERHRSYSEVRIRLRDELPIALGADVFNPPMRVGHRRGIIFTAGFQQQHADIWILRESPRYHRARRT